MSLPSFTAAAKPTSRAARRAARNRAQTLVELIGADSGQYPTQQEIDERVNAWADRVIPDADLTPPATVISNRASTSAPDPIALTDGLPLPLRGIGDQYALKMRKLNRRSLSFEDDRLDLDRSLNCEPDLASR